MNKPVLYVDDEVAMLDLIKVLLEAEGYAVLTAANPDEALQKASGKTFGLIILDVNLAGDSGLMLMNFMKHNHNGVPVILYTGGDHEQSAMDTMLELGATKYVHKSNGSELVAAARQLYPIT